MSSTRVYTGAFSDETTRLPGPAVCMSLPLGFVASGVKTALSKTTVSWLLSRRFYLKRQLYDNTLDPMLKTTDKILGSYNKDCTTSLEVGGLSPQTPNPNISAMKTLQGPLKEPVQNTALPFVQARALHTTLPTGTSGL